MTDFKVGDRVKVVNDKQTKANIGHTGVIQYIEGDGYLGTYPIRVTFDDASDDRTGDIFDADELELFPAATPEPRVIDYELRERMIVQAVKVAGFEWTYNDIVNAARAFETYILGDIK